jgi:hypothetical protein
MRDPNSLSKDYTHMISLVPLATVLYSASVLLRDTISCLRALQEIRFGPKNIAYPPMDRRSSGLPAQSASEKAARTVGESDRRWRPNYTV